MKNPISHINKAFENRIRLGIMSILMVNDRADFLFLKETLELTDGNLASHLIALEKAGYIEVNKTFVGKKPNTSYVASTEGRQAFWEHIDALENLLKNTKG